MEQPMEQAVGVPSSAPQAPQAPEPPPLSSSGGNRVKNACTECKRRKVKCDGTEPCYYCRWYKHPERCVYPRPALRPILTRKSLDTLRSKLEDATNVLKRLFPASSLDDLIPLSREALVALLDDVQSRDVQSSDRRTSTAVASISEGNALSVSPGSTHVPGASRSPAAFEYDESVEDLEGTEAVADDVNALSLRPDRTSSYVGASSATAGLRILLKIAPDLRSAKPKPPEPRSGSSGPNFGPPFQITERGAAAIVPRNPRSLIDAYFRHVHPSTPILNESEFRAAFESNERKDSAWLALLHMVFALGTIAYTTSDSNEDIYYYKIAKSHVSLDSFGSGHIETLQALVLMTGWYLHYRNRPNMASAIMGAVFRMANALGLHKELPGGENDRDKQQRELRRRIWWSLVVLDAGEGTTLGRVSNTSIFDSEVKIPRNIDDATGETVTGPTVYSAFIGEIAFSRQASKIQERLISSPSLEFAETLALDAHLVYWFESLPSFLHVPAQCPDWLLQPRLSTKWKYQNLRLILHRPTLMEAILRGVPFQDLHNDQKVCVRKCQSLASQAIENIALEWTKNQYSGWPAVWFLFQACIIPLLSLYGFKDDPRQTEGWNRQVQKALQLFQEMEPWSIAARQTHELVSLLFEAYHSSQGPNANSLENASTLIPSVRFPDNPQASMAPGNNQSIIELPLWEGLVNFPDLMSPVSAFPDLNFPELGPGVEIWDIPMEMEAWSETFDASMRHVQADDRTLRRGGMFNGGWGRRHS